MTTFRSSARPPWVIHTLARETDKMLIALCGAHLRKRDCIVTDNAKPSKAQPCCLSCYNQAVLKGLV